MIERINELLARRFGGVGTTAGSFVRIHVWALVFLIVASLVVRSHEPNLAFKARLGPVESVTLDYSDQRAFGPSAFPKQAFHIAWIAGSESLVTQLKSRSPYVPTLLLRALPQIEGRRVVVDLYYLPAMRAADLYFSLLDAVAAKPDLIVMSLNPVWAMNPVSTHQWTQLDAKAARALSTKPEAWPVAASLLSPSDLMWGVTGSFFKPFRDRSYYSATIHDLVDDLGPLNRSQLVKAAAAHKPDLYNELLATLPLDVWFQYRLHLPRDKAGAAADVDAPAAKQPLGGGVIVATGVMSPNRWGQWIAASNHGDNPLNRMLMRAIGKELRDSKIPSYVYLAQVNSEWLTKYPAVGSAIAGVEKQLTDLSGDFAATNIRYVPQTVSRFIKPLVFLPGDPVHMERAAPIGRYMADQLCQTLAQWGKGPRCGAAKEGSASG